MAWLIIAGVLSVPSFGVFAFRPVSRRLALRYPLRRPTEAALVLLGTLLGTTIITGSLVVGDTIDRSIRASAYEQLGPIDELVTVSGLERGAEVEAAFAEFESPYVDGVLSFLSAPVAVQGAATQPRAQLIEIDFEAAEGFGGDPEATGVSGSTPLAGHAVVTGDLAERTLVDEGDMLRVFAYGRRLDVEVDRVVERTGLAGFWPIDSRQQSYNLLVGPGTLAGLVADVDLDGETTEPPSAHTVFSNHGGVEAGADLTEDALADIDEIAQPLGTRGQPVKRDQLAVATAAAEGLSQLYVTMGMFAVSAGVLLVVNIFVMLADDRRSELGMLRAMGMRRLPLVGAFATEGWLYSLGAGAFGSLLGIGFGWVIAWRASEILSSNTDQNSLTLTFNFDWATVLQGFAIGFAISLLTIIATSVRVSRMNVIAAIRNLPGQPRRSVRRRWLGLGVVLLVAGSAVFAWSLPAGDGYAFAIGPMLAVLGAGPLLASRLSTKVATTIVSLVELAWGVGFIGALDVVGLEIGITAFLVQGLAMATAAVALVSVHQESIGRLAGRLTGNSLAVRLGLAYPIARRFRTAMTLGMFSVVILTLVYLSIVSFMFRTQVDKISDGLSGGFGVVVNSNPTNPVRTDDLLALPGVDAVAPLGYGSAYFAVAGRDPEPWPITGFGPELADAPPALQDRGTYESDLEAWQAVLADPGLAIVDEFFLQTGAGLPIDTLAPGDQFVIIDQSTGRSQTVTVAATAEEDFLFNGVFYGAPGLAALGDGPTVPTRFFVAPTDDPSELATSIRTRFVQNGADAEAVVDSIETMLAQQSGFFTLMQQFVGVGLVVGIAGIGVIMVRAVRERRREVGVLRALGFPARTVGRALLVEAGFVAVEGISIGVLVAIVGSYGLVWSGASFIADFAWGVPWDEVALVVAVALAASAMAAAWPARRATRIRPAEALRLAD